MVGFGQAMLNPVFDANTVEQQIKGIAVRRAIGKLDAVICQNGVDLLRYSGNQAAQEFNRDHPRHPLV